jgi:hypothetical protein
MDKDASSTSALSLSPLAMALSVAWAVVVAIGGGVLVGALMARFGLLGILGFWVLGIVAGFVARQINRRGIPWVGWMLVGAVMLAFFIGECYWLRYAKFVRNDGAGSWLEALQMFFSQMGRTQFLLALVCAGMGAYNAYQAAGSRWRYLMVRE